MKTKILAILTLALSMPAFAVWAPKWERPREVARMDVLKADGVFEKLAQAEVTLNRRDGASEAATSLSLKYESIDAAGNPVTVEYTAPVQEVAFNRCGGMAIKTRLKLYDETMASGYFPELEIDLVRMHSELGVRCVDADMPHGDGWNANVRFVERGSVNSVSTMDLKGFPEPLMTIQNTLLE